MHRQIIYPGQLPIETDLLNTNRNTLIGLGFLAQDVLGSSTAAAGLACTATAPASLAVQIGAGRLYSLANVDGTAYSSLPVDTTHQVLKQGILLDPVTLATPAPVTAGFSVNYLIEAIYQDVDTNNTVLPYFNSANPNQTFSGPNNLGTAQPTQRQGQIVLVAKAGIPATTGTQTTSAPDVGYVGLWVVTVANGQATVTSGNISAYGAAPFISTGPYLSGARTAAEISAGVNPVALGYNPYDVRRYGARGDGVTDDSAVFNLAATIGLPIFVPDPPVAWLLNSDVTGTFQSFGYPKFTGAGQITIRDLSMNDADNIEAVCQALEAGTATNIAFFGDSTMWGAVAGPLTQAATPPYTQCVNAINNFFGNTAATAVNFSISGTTLNQMLRGTDGSGLTYAQRLASTNAPIIFVNHGQNDAAGGGGVQTTASVYRANLVSCIRLTRVAGKTLIFVTPHPGLTMGSFGTQFRAEQVSRFRDIMLDVAAQHGVRVVDNFKWLRLWMGTLQTVTQTNINLPLTIMPDGVHGTQATYTFTGNNLSDGILHGLADSFTGPDQRVLAARPLSQATGQAFSSSTSSYTGGAVVTGTVGAQSMRLIFRTETPGLDISIMHSIYNLGASAIGINLDGVSVGIPSWSQNSAGFTNSGSGFLQDIETTIARNIAPGLHQLTITTVGPNAIAINGLRSRATQRPIMLGNSTQDMCQRQLLTPKIQLQAGAAGGVIVMTDIAVSRFTESLELEWIGQMVKNSEVVIAGTLGTTAGTPTLERMIGFGLNGSGFAHFVEATAPGTYNNTALDAVDHSGASHTYRVVLTQANPGTIAFFIDDVQIGATTALTQAFFGGWLGVWKNLNTDVLTLTNISRVWHF